MRKNILLTVLLSAIVPCKTILAQNCALGTATQILTFNDVKFRINNSGLLFLNKALGTAAFTIPANSNTNTIYASNFWLSGYVEVDPFTGEGIGSPKMAIGTYDTNGDVDFTPGPLTSPEGLTNPELCGVYDKIFTIKKSEIDLHKQNFNQAGYIIPNRIANWPGSNPLISYQIAPYFDANNNNIYEPQLGEYPIIKGDEAAFFIINDKGKLHTNSGADPIGATLQIMLYTWYNNTAPLNQTIFMDVALGNRGTQTLFDTYFGLWTDFDLGNPIDDYIGTLYNKNAYYVYNGDANDETSSTIGYGLNPPTQAVVFLNNNLSRTTYHNNSGGPYGDPEVQGDFANYTRSRWKDSSPFLFGGTANQSSSSMNYPRGTVNSTSFASHIFPGNSDPNGETTGGTANYGQTQAWTEVSAGLTPGDRRMIGSNGPFTFLPGEVKNYSFAYVFSRATSGQDPIDKLNDDIDLVKNFYDGATGIVKYNNKKEGIIKVYPNPSNQNSIEINGAIGDIQVFNAIGQLMMNVSANNLLAKKLDIAQLPKGVYIIKDNAGNSSQFVKQ